MASKYYNPRLASSVAAAKQAGFFDAGKGVAEGFKTAFEGASPYVMGALKEYQEDVEKIYDINFDSNGIALDKIEDLTSFVKQERENAFQARQKGILPGKEATGEAMLNVQGAAKVAKYHGGVVQQIQSFLQDPDQVSEANEQAALPMLSSIVNAKIDYTDKDGKFFVLADGTKLSMKDLENELGSLIVTPDEAYNEFFDYADTITPKKESYEGTTYYTFDEMDSNKIKTKAYGLIDKYGKDFVWDALSNSSPFRGVTVADFIDPKLKLQTKSKSKMEDIIADTYNLDKNNKQAIFDKAKQLVADGYTEAAKNMYPTRPKIVKPEKPTQREIDEQAVKQDVLRAAEMLKTKDFNPTISKIGSLSETRNIQNPESYKAQINKLTEELKNLGVGARAEYEQNEEGEDTNILKGFVIYPTRTLLNTKKTEQIITTSQTPNQIKKAILDALGRSYGTLDLPYDQLINTENSLPKF